MQKVFVGLFLSLILSFSAFAEPLKKPFLWKAEKNGQVAYLLGTFHIGFTLDDLPRSVLERIEDSGTFFMETDLTTVSQDILIGRATFSGGQSLDQFLPKESWQELVDLLSHVMPAEKLKSFKPWYIQNLLITGLAMQQLNLEGGMDVDLLEYARAKGVEIRYLESAETQLAVLESISPADFLDYSLKNSENLITDTKEGTRQLYDCYLAGDLKCLEKMFESPAQGLALQDWQTELLLKQRNRTWIPVIEKSLSSQPTFIAVGVGHLLGSENVLELLEQEGFKIEAVAL